MFNIRNNQKQSETIRQFSTDLMWAHIISEHLLPREDIPRLRKLRLSENRISQMRQDQPPEWRTGTIPLLWCSICFICFCCCGMAIMALTLSHVDPVFWHILAWNSQGSGSIGQLRLPQRALHASKSSVRTPAAQRHSGSSQIWGRGMIGLQNGDDNNPFANQGVLWSTSIRQEIIYIYKHTYT